MNHAATLSLSLKNARRHHVAGLPWTKLLTYGAWLALLAFPVALIVHYEVEQARLNAPVKAAVEQAQQDEARSIHALEQALGHKLGGE